MTEEWRPVLLGLLRIPGNYEVSNLGRVRRASNSHAWKAGRLLKPYECPTRNGSYLKVDLRQDGERYPLFVHQLVAQAFIPNPDLKPEVNHLDTDNFNNCLDNLEWATRQEQEAHKRFFDLTEATA